MAENNDSLVQKGKDIARKVGGLFFPETLHGYTVVHKHSPHIEIGKWQKCDKSGFGGYKSTMDAGWDRERFIFHDSAFDALHSSGYGDIIFSVDAKGLDPTTHERRGGGKMKFEKAIPDEKLVMFAATCAETVNNMLEYPDNGMIENCINAAKYYAEKPCEGSKLAASAAAKELWDFDYYLHVLDLFDGKYRSYVENLPCQAMGFDLGIEGGIPECLIAKWRLMHVANSAYCAAISAASDDRRIIKAAESANETICGGFGSRYSGCWQEKAFERIIESRS